MKPQLVIPSQSNKRRFLIGVMLALVVIGGVVSLFTSGSGESRPKAQKAEVVVSVLPPPPPPPPITPPPPPPPPKEQEMVEQKPVEVVEPEPAPMPAPQDEALSTNLTGNGPDMGLRHGSGNGSGNQNQIGSGRRGGKWDRYAVSVQNTIADTLRRHSDVRHASFSLQVRIWADRDGRITRANLLGSSGNTTVDQAIRNQVLTGMQLPEPPPADMPMPINMRISARKS